MELEIIDDSTVTFKFPLPNPLYVFRMGRQTRNLYLPGFPLDDTTGDEHLLHTDSYFWEDPDTQGTYFGGECVQRSEMRARLATLFRFSLFAGGDGVELAYYSAAAAFVHLAGHVPGRQFSHSS